MAAALTDNALTILSKRYLDGESVDSMWDRVSGGNPKFRRLLSELLFLPNSPTLFNAGKGNGCTLSACFVMDVRDQMFGPSSITDVRNKAIAIAKAGGGVGYYFGHIRPKGSLIKSIHRKACGPVAVMRDYHGIHKLVTQGGKRDLAQMGVLDCDHPDIEEFIHCKDADPQSLSSFNISVGWKRDWVNRVQFHYSSSPNGNGEATNKETRLWREQCQSAWQHGCPGMFFPDTVNERRGNPNPQIGYIHAPNPCFSGSTLVWTIYGPRRFDELVGSEVPVLTQKQGKLVFRMMRNIRKTGTSREVNKVVVRSRRGRTKKGDKPRYVQGSFTATPDHPVFMRDGTQKNVEELCSGDRVLSAYRISANQKGYMALKSTSGDQDMEHRVVMSWVLGYRPDYPAYHVHHKDGDKVNNTPDNLELLLSSEHNSSHMRGDNNPVVRFPEKNVFSRPNFRELYGDGGGFGGHVHTETSKQRIGEALRRYQQKRKGPNHEVVSVEPAGREDVYDGEVDDTHRFFIITENDGAVMVHNCGETPNRGHISDTASGEPCNLGSLVLGRFYNSANRDVGWNALEEAVYTATEFLDDILDRNEFPHPDITEAALLTRKLGLGVMGWADLLAMLHIPYDSEEAIALADKVSKFISDVGRQARRDMAKTKGPYKGYNATLTQDECLRNETGTSIAPTGTIGLIGGVKGFSIEPWFALRNSRTTNEGIRMLEDVPEWIREQLDGYVPKVAHEITPEWHIRHQAAWQKNVDLGVSKTINMPNSATVEDVSNAYKMMHELSCKGGTVFRDGCRDEQVLVTEKSASVYSLPGRNGSAGHTPEPPAGDTVVDQSLPTVPQHPLLNVTDRLIGQCYDPTKEHHLPETRCSITHKYRVGETTGFFTVGLFGNGRPAEIFLRVSKIGSSIGGMLDTWAISFSLALQNGTPLETLCRHHIGTRFEPAGMTGDKDVPIASSIPDYICRWLLLRFSQSPTGTEKEDITPRMRSGQLCPECGTEVMLVGGCLTCPVQSCGWSKCG